MPRYAAIDIGSNSVRLLVAEAAADPRSQLPVLATLHADRSDLAVVHPYARQSVNPPRRNPVIAERLEDQPQGTLGSVTDLLAHCEEMVGQAARLDPSLDEICEGTAILCRRIREIR